jgi:hypothetical protein
MWSGITITWEFRCKNCRTINEFEMPDDAFGWSNKDCSECKQKFLGTYYRKDLHPLKKLWKRMFEKIGNNIVE